MKKVFIFLSILLCLVAEGAAAAQKNKGRFSNMVVFVRFPDQASTPFSRKFAAFDQMFNDSTTATANSVYNYFKSSSYGQLFWKSSFYPQPAADNTVLSYTAQNIREYYQPYSETYPNGYKDDIEAKSREQALIKEIALFLAANVPADAVIDTNDDGLVDNICIVIAGTSDINSTRLLWPHRGAFLLANPPLINGKRIAEYLMVFDDGNGIAQLKWLPLDTSVLCHEMSHTLGTYDLYHEQRGLNPVGAWDLMSNNGVPPQQMMAYTKFRYCLWLDQIPEISTPGVYTLNPVGGSIKENIAYKIKPLGSDEYFIVEYRNNTNTFDTSVPSSGLIVYRINPLFSGGNIGYNGTTRLDETYIFRPGGTTTADGDLSKAAFCAESGRTAFGGTAAQKPFYSDGREAKFAISEVSACGETISFRLLPFVKQIYLPLTSISLLGSAGSTSQAVVRSDVAWTVTGAPDWLQITPASGAAGETTVTVTALSANKQPTLREGSITFTGTPETDLTAVLSVHQQSDLVQAPATLAAAVSGNQVNVTWAASIEGEPLFNQGFENPADHAGWTITTANYREWQWTLSDKFNPSYQGNYSGRVLAAFEDRHQDERLISPAFSHGKILSFYSKTPAVGRINAHNFYRVEVSTDGGATWQSVFNIMTQGKLVNKYERIDIDLSAYSAENMKIAFHAYDDNNLGLAYTWQVDNVAVYTEVTQSIIQGYDVYRNGVKIGHSDNLSFVDNSPLQGANTYAVRAVGAWGETPDSPTATVNFSSTGIDPLTAAQTAVKLYVSGSELALESDVPMKWLQIYSVQGVQLLSAPLSGNSCQVSIARLPKGAYAAAVTCEGERISAKVKFLKR